MESFEIMEFCNKWWNYITPLYVIMMEKLCSNKFPLFHHYFNIKWIFLFFSPVGVPQYLRHAAKSSIL